MIEIAIEDSFQNKIYQDLYSCKPWQFQNFRLNVETVTLFRQQDIVGFKIIPNQVTPMPLLPHCQLQQRNLRMALLIWENQLVILEIIY
jgi:hypothetical protein